MVSCAGFGSSREAERAELGASIVGKDQYGTFQIDAAMADLPDVVGAGRQGPPPCGWNTNENVRSLTVDAQDVLLPRSPWMDVSGSAPKRIEIGR